MLLILRAECLAGAAQKAALAGDQATSARMFAEAIEAFTQARELAEQARNQ